MIFQKLTSTYRVMASARIMLIVCVVATVLILNIETCSAVKREQFHPFRYINIVVTLILLKFNS